MSDCLRESNWYGIDICTKCESSLNDGEKMSSGGICPSCGFNSGSTVCDTEKIILKEISHHPWWRFWDKTFTYKGLTSDSERWLNKNNYSQ